MDTAKTFVAAVANFLQLVVGWVLLLVAIAVTINAIARYGVGRDVALITEAGGFVFLFVTFIGLAGAYLAGQHVAVELLDVIAPPALVHVIRRYVTPILMLAFLLTLILASGAMTMRYFHSGRMTIGMTPMPFWIFMSFVPIGSSVMFLVVLFDFLKPGKSVGDDDVNDPANHHS